MFTLFRTKQQATPVPPAPALAPAPPVETEQQAYDRAWADYAEWSGLDQDGLASRRPAAPHPEWNSVPLPYSAA